MKSDGSPTTILPSTAIGATEAAATATNSIAVRGFKEIDFSFLVANLGTGPITDIRGRVYYSILASPGAFSAAPEALQKKFIIASALANAGFWIILGLLSGYLLRHKDTENKL